MVGNRAMVASVASMIGRSNISSVGIPVARGGDSRLNIAAGDSKSAATEWRKVYRCWGSETLSAEP